MTTSSDTVTDTLTVSLEECGLRLDKLLSSHFPKFSRTYFQYLIENGCVLVNGSAIKKREKPNTGDEIEICFLLTPEISLEPEDIPLDILYEDEYLLAVNKPVGMVVHPAPGHPNHTFVNALLHHCKIKVSDDNLRPGIVHRLDKDTSGVLLAAKTQEAHMRLVERFSKREIEKTYLAICVGNPGNQTVQAPIRRHPTRRQEMAVIEDGKEAISRVRTLASDGKLSLVEVDLITGRTHQIRVHLKYINTPVLGDTVYGNDFYNDKHEIHRQLLHAKRLQFYHPFSNEILTLDAPVPKDMDNFIVSLEKKNKD